MPDKDINPEEKSVAIASEGLYLLNLLFPVLPLLVLLIIFLKNKQTNSVFLKGHLIQPLIAALLGTALFVIINIIAAVFGGYSNLDDLVSIQTLIALEVYTLAVILPFTVPGLLGLTKAMAGQSYRYPLIGRFL